MSEADEIIAIIRNEKTPMAQLKDLQNAVREQLARYSEAEKILAAADGDAWTYDVYQAVLQAGSGGHGASVSRAEWDRMFPQHRLRTRDDTAGALRAGRAQFAEINEVLDSEIKARSSARPWWKFWT